MKLLKITISLFVIAGICFGGFMFMSSKSAEHSEPKGRLHSNTPQELKSLQALGFKNVQNLDLGENYDMVVNPEKVAYWKNKFNVQFIGSNGIQQYLKQHNLILGKAEDFRGEVPAESIKEMNEAIVKLTPAPEQSLYYINASVLPENGIIAYIPESKIKPDMKKTLNEWMEGGSVNYASQGLYRDMYTEGYFNDRFFLHHTTTKGTTAIQKIMVMVAAPADEFDATNKEIVNRTLVERKKRDPLVLGVVEDGYVVLAKWF